jgi:hypothetical protein
MKRTSLILTEVASVLVFPAAAGVQHWFGHGIERGLLSLPIVLAPCHARRLLAITGRAPSPSPLLLLLEAGAIAGAFFDQAPPWAVGLALAMAFMLAWSTDPGPARPPSRALETLALLAVLAAGGSVLLDVHYDTHSIPLLRILTYGVVLLEAIRAPRERSDQDSLRRLAAAAALVGTSALCIKIFWSLGQPHLIRVLATGFVGVPAALHLASARRGVVDRTRERRRIGMRVAASALVVALIVGTGEIGFRVFPNRYRDLVTYGNGFWHEPGKKYVYEGALLTPRQPFTNVVIWNKDGWHDVDHERAKPPGIRRLIVLGDSYVEAVQVPVDDLYHRRLERALAARSDRPVEAVGLGTSGWGQVQELSCLRMEGFSYDADLVVLEFLPANDIRNNDDVLEAIDNDQSLRATRARELFVAAARSHLFSVAFVCDHIDFALRRFLGTVEPIDCDVYRAEPRVRPDRWAASWKRTEGLLADMKTELAARGCALVVVIFTSISEIDACVPGWQPAQDGMDPCLPARRMTEICRRLEIPCLDLAPRFAKHPAEVRHAFHIGNGDGHWSSSGHAEAASETAKFLLDETDLWKRALEHASR